MKRYLRRRLEEPFAREYVKQRTVDNGQVFDYLEGHMVIQRFNDVMDGHWGFEVLDFQIQRDSAEAMVLGKLTASDGTVKCQFGSAILTTDPQTGKFIGIGDDLKAAATDALKKCATLLGVGLYLYNREGIPSRMSSQKISKNNPEQTPQKPSAISLRAAEISDTLSPKQLELIQKLVLEKNISLEEVDALCKTRSGKVLTGLSKVEASRLIEALLTGDIKDQMICAI